MISIFNNQIGGCPCCLARVPVSQRPSWLPTFKGFNPPAAARRGYPMPLSGRIRLDGGTIVNPRDGALVVGKSILIDKGRIVAIDEVARRDDPTVQRVDASGKFVVPGFNDMHTHVLELEDPSGALALMLAEGVTGFRQMSGSAKLLEERRSDSLPIGRLAPALLEMPGDILTPLNASSAEDVATEIGLQKRQGADFIKAGLMSAEVFRAALKEAGRVGIAFLGHLQEGVGAAEAAEAGFKSVEHLGPGATVWVGCSRVEAEFDNDASWLPKFKKPPFKIPFLRSLIMRRFQTMLVNPAAFAAPPYVARMQRAMETYDEGKCNALVARFAAAGTWHVPTLVRLRTQELADAPEYQQHTYLEYMPRKKIKTWRKVTERFRRLPPVMRATFAGAYPRQLKLTQSLAQGGVRMMTGTDGGWLAAPGLTLQEEFIELGKAGLSPLKILQMTTINAAEYLGRSGTMGTIEVGRDANMVVLDANPLEKVENLSRISAVWRAGFHYPRAELEALKRRVAKGRGYLCN